MCHVELFGDARIFDKSLNTQVSWGSLFFYDDKDLYHICGRRVGETMKDMYGNNIVPVNY